MKKISLLLLSLFVFGALMAQNGVDKCNDAIELNKAVKFKDAEKCVDGKITQNPENKEMWDLLWYFEANAGAQPGIETDGTHIYCPTWNAETISRYDMDGGNATDFTITDVSNLRDLAYDGTYFYGAAATMDLKVMDLANETLISTISASCTGVTGIRHIAFDPTLDGGNGGFWIGNWSELGAIDMDGNELVANQGNISCYGSAYDDTDPDNPVLWLFQQTGVEEVTFAEFDINTLSYTGVTHEASDVPGFETGSLAGGACTWDDPETGKKLLIGSIQQVPNLVFAYELSGESTTLTYDMELLGLDIPSEVEVNEEIQIMGEVKNLGSETVTSFDVSYTIDGGTPIVSSITGVSVGTDETYDFTADETVTFDTEGTYAIEVTIENINGNADEDPSNNTLIHSIDVATSVSWPVVWSFDANSSGQPGVETDGNNIYCPTWNEDTITRYDMDGANATNFVIAGVSNIRDLAYDGTYFYGAAANMDLKVMDLANETLISTISASCTGVTGIRHIAYDPTLDDGNGGFWIGNWSELGAIDMDGNELIANLGNANCYGSAWDNSDNDNPVLWLFQLNGVEEVTFHEFDINTLSFTGFTYEASDVPGFVPGSTAGGACTWDDPETGQKLLIGNIQQTPNLIFAYELVAGTTTPTYDMELLGLNIPIEVNVNEEIQIMGEVKNLGSETVTSFDVSYTIDGGTPIVSSITGVSVGTDETYDFTADETVTFDTEGTYAIEVTIENINGNADEDPSNNTLTHSIEVISIPTYDQWDVVWSFDATAGGQAGIETDGNHIYCPTWNAETITRYDMDGGNPTDFTIADVANLRDLAYDGTYFYGAAADMNLKVMDFENEVLINTISASCSGVTGIRHIAYDPTLDNGGGGFWIGNWAELGAIDMEGNELVSNQPNESCYGSAYDDSDPFNPVLWLFQQNGPEEVTFHEFDINTLSYTGFTHEASDIPGFESGSIAGGACTWDDPVLGIKLLIGNIQQTPNLIFAYNLTGDSPGNLFEDNFDTYVAGEMVACQNPDVWTTWANDPCGDDDAYVSDTYAYSAPNSVNIVTADDLVLDLDEYLTSGKHSVSLMIYVPTGGNAYYNLLSSFTPSQEWAFEVYFNAGGDGEVNAGVSGAATFNYEFDTWMESKVIVDLNADWAEYYIDGTLICEWQWTLGASGGGCALQLGAMDFYGQPDSDYYFDDLIIQTDPSLPAPMNLTATVNDNDVELNWTAIPPSSNNFIGYNVFRDGDLIAEEITELFYNDNDLLPNTYVYDVKAIYDEGVSASAGPVEAIIEGGVERDLVIIEVATGTWCGYCPGAAMGVDEMHAEGLSVGVIEYHGGDDYETTESDARIDFYGITGYPTAVFDGIDQHVGGSATTSLYETYLPKYEARIATPSLFEIQAEYFNNGGNNYQVVVDAEMIETYPWLTNEIVLQVVLTESHIPEIWGVIMDELNFVCRDMIPDENGTTVDFSNSATQSVTLDFTIPSEYEMINLELVAFIQDNTTKEILQGTMAVFIEGINDMTGETTIEVYPNPATDVVNINSDVEISTITVYNGAGQVMTVEEVENTKYSINTSKYETGVYFIHVNSENGLTIEKIVIK